MKAYYENVRKYYKYTAWTQPVFTSNTTWGIVSADNYSTGSNQYPYQALDGKTSGGDEADFAAGDSAKTVNWYWDFAEPLKITAIKIWNRNNAGSYGGATTYTISGKNSNGTYEQIGTLSLASTAWVSGTSSLTSTKMYYGIKIYCDGAKTYVGIGEILLTAYTANESTSSDYDFYKDIDEYSICKKTIRTYYKRSSYTSNGTYTVPSNVTKLKIDCVGAKGKDDSSSGGNGGRVQCDLAVSSGTTLYITIGSAPTDARVATYNASDIRIGGNDYSHRVIVAGGGGSSGHDGGRGGFYGGAGGGLIGQDGGKFTDGDPCCGYGGTQSAGGGGGYTTSTYYYSNGSDGSLGDGGNGGSYGTGRGGAGGGGYYGGGGGGCYAYYGTAGGGGGGGSSYTNSSCSNIVHTQGYNNGAGYVSIAYESTSSDYDYYEDTTDYKAFNV